jgi:arginine exporter protein ArgO
VHSRPMRIVLAIVGLCALALFTLGMVQVASSVMLSPALIVAIVLLGGLLVLIFAWLLLYTDERGVL